jgi:hypothetical protein
MTNIWSMKFTIQRTGGDVKPTWIVSRDNSEMGIASTVAEFDTVGKALYYIKKRVE